MSLQEYIAERNRVDLLAETSAGQVQDSTDELRRQLRKALFEGMYIDADRYAKRALAVRRDSEFNQKKSGRSGSENTFRQQTDAMLVCLMKQKLEKEDDKGLKKLETAIQSNKFTTIYLQQSRFYVLDPKIGDVCDSTKPNLPLLSTVA